MIWWTRLGGGGQGKAKDGRAPDVNDARIVQVRQEPLHALSPRDTPLSPKGDCGCLALEVDARNLQAARGEGHVKL